jgi:CHAD domain-containing protein
MPASTGRPELLRKRLERFTRLLQALEEGDVVAVHRTRVASRRLRELLPVLELEAEVAHKLSRRLRKVTERLGTVRELDVLAMVIDELTESERIDKAALSRISAEVSRERAEAREKLLAKTLPVTELKRIARKLGRVVESLESADTSTGDRRRRARGWRYALDARVAHRASALEAAIRDAGAVYLPERLHAVRIAVKKFRYVMELSAEVAGVHGTPELRTLKRTQDLLGRLHDFQVLIGRVRQMQASLTPANLAAWRGLDVVVTVLEDSCRRLHARYMRERSQLEAICERAGGRPHSAAARRAAV